MPDTMIERLPTRAEERRAVALRAMDRFAEKHGASNRQWVEVDEGDHIALVGTTDDGRRFWLGYTKATAQELADG